MRAHTRSLTDPTAAQGTPTITMKRNETKTKENDMMKKGMENVFECWKKEFKWLNARADFNDCRLHCSIGKLMKRNV